MTIISRIRQLLTTHNGTVLEGEGIPVPIADPTPEILRRELEHLRSSGPSFLALLATTGSYLQAAGTAKRLTVEAHIMTPEHPIHVVLGRQGLLGSATTVVSTGGPIDVYTSEVWAALAAAELFRVFATTGALPSDVARRDISAAITGLQLPEPDLDPLGETTP